MLIEMATESGKGAAPLVPAGISVTSKIAVIDREKEPEAKEKPAVVDLARLVADAQLNLNAMHDVALNFSVHESSGRTVITVADEATGNIIREIPSSEFLELSTKLNEMAGVLFDYKG